jgi:hypothetical protein
VRADGVVGLPPATDQHLHLQEGVEDFPVQQLVSKFAIEALHVAVLLWRSRLDEERLHPDPSFDFIDVGFRLAAPVAVPEPSTYAMALAGLACGGYLVRRRRKLA